MMAYIKAMRKTDEHQQKMVVYYFWHSLANQQLAHYFCGHAVAYYPEFSQLTMWSAKWLFETLRLWLRKYCYMVPPHLRCEYLRALGSSGFLSGWHFNAFFLYAFLICNMKNVKFRIQKFIQMKTRKFIFASECWGTLKVLDAIFSNYTGPNVMKFFTPCTNVHVRQIGHTFWTQHLKRVVESHFSPWHVCLKVIFFASK